MAYHVFISYRRDGGDAMARLLYDRLRADHYDPFLDVEQMRSGKFNEQLLERIAECEDFLLVLPPNALERCRDEEDWVRLEIREAIRLNKNIVPFMLRGFEFPSDMPEDIREIRHYQGVAASQDYFDSSMDKLRKLLSYVPRTTAETNESVPKHTIQIGNKVYEVDEGTTRQDIIARNKARRVETGKTVFMGLLIIAAAAAITCGLNLLVRQVTNHVLDLWLFANGEGSVDAYGFDQPAILMLMAAIMLIPCIILFAKGHEIESITLKILAVVLYVLTVLILHLLPKLILGLAIIALVVGLLISVLS